jgi:hypothetical protein
MPPLGRAPARAAPGLPRAGRPGRRRAAPRRGLFIAAARRAGRHGQRGGPPPAAGHPVRTAAPGGVPSGGPSWTRSWAPAAVRVPPGVRVSYELPDQRRDRPAGLDPDPPARPGPDEGDRQGAAGHRPGRPDVPRPVRRGLGGRRQLLPDLEPDHARQERGGPDRAPAEDRRQGDPVRDGRARHPDAGRADGHRGQDLAGLRPAAVRAVAFLRGSDESAERCEARSEHEPSLRAPCIHAQQDHDIRAGRAPGAGRRPAAEGRGERLA